MVSDIITIRSSGDGQEKALREAEKAAVWCGLDEKETLHARLIAEEMMGLIRSVSGEIDADFHIETLDKRLDFYLVTAMLMNEATREELIGSSSEGRNDAAKGLMGHIRDFMERAMISGAGSYVFAENMTEVPVSDLPEPVYFEPEWDHYERSILKNIADRIVIAIRGNRVEMLVSKDFK